ncbi:unnamed protein product [Lota lota]
MSRTAEGGAEGGGCQRSPPGFKMAPRPPGPQGSPKKSSSLNLVTGFYHYLRGSSRAPAAAAVGLKRRRDAVTRGRHARPSRRLGSAWVGKRRQSLRRRAPV